MQQVIYQTEPNRRSWRRSITESHTATIAKLIGRDHLAEVRRNGVIILKEICNSFKEANDQIESWIEARQTALQIEVTYRTPAIKRGKAL